MEVSELLKMISSIDQKKSNCRGNLRLKVLLKSTHDYARLSWMDGQSGNPQRLQTMLQNSIVDRSSELLAHSADEGQESTENINIEQFCLSETDDFVEEEHTDDFVTVDDPEMPREIWEEHFAPIVKDEDHTYYSTIAPMFIYCEKEMGTEQAINLCQSVLEGHISFRNKKKTSKPSQDPEKTASDCQENVSKVNRFDPKDLDDDSMSGRTFETKCRPQKRSLSDANDDDCESLLELNGFFNKLKTLKCSDDNVN